MSKRCGYSSMKIQNPIQMKWCHESAGYILHGAWMIFSSNCTWQAIQRTRDGHEDSSPSQFKSTWNYTWTGITANTLAFGTSTIFSIIWGRWTLARGGSKLRLETRVNSHFREFLRAAATASRFWVFRQHASTTTILYYNVRLIQNTKYPVFS